MLLKMCYNKYDYISMWNIKYNMKKPFNQAHYL